MSIPDEVVLRAAQKICTLDATGPNRPCNCTSFTMMSINCGELYEKQARAALSASGYVEMREALEKHQSFFDSLCEVFFDDGCLSMDGADFQALGVNAGLLECVPFDPAVHKDTSGAAEPGDDFYRDAGIARAALTMKRETGT